MENHNRDQDRRLASIEKHIGTLNEEVGEIQIDIAKIKGKLNAYALIMPILTGILGFLMSKLF